MGITDTAAANEGPGPFLTDSFEIFKNHTGASRTIRELQEIVKMIIESTDPAAARKAQFLTEAPYA